MEISEVILHTIYTTITIYLNNLINNKNRTGEVFSDS